MLAIAQSRADVLGKVGAQWLICVYLLHTVGELCLSPIGLSMVTKLAPVTSRRDHDGYLVRRDRSRELPGRDA